ncbi:MAG: LysE family transporter [Armatimonadota bacterium]
MALGFFAKGIIIGFSIAAPVGPIGILCIRRTLAYGRASGFVSGLGAASADAMYAAVAGFGLTAISHFLISNGLWLRLFGGVFLLCLGIKIFLTKPALMSADHRHEGLIEAYLSTVVLTLANPMTILSYTAVFAGLGVGAIGHGLTSAVEIVSGTFVGSSLWWLTLSIGVGFVSNSLDRHMLKWVNRGAGVIILAFAVLIMANVRLA